MTQLSLRELLTDPIFRAWSMKTPKLKPSSATSDPWRVYVKLDGKWRSREFSKYSLAWNWLAKNLSRFDDAAINCKRQEHPPPVVKDSKGVKHRWPCPPGHRWCGYCRRPTKFSTYRRHHAMGNLPIAPYDSRCSICGCRAKAQRRWRSSLKSRWA